MSDRLSSGIVRVASLICSGWPSVAVGTGASAGQGDSVSNENASSVEFYMHLKCCTECFIVFQVFFQR